MSLSPDEVVLLILGSATLFFAITRWDRLATVPSRPMLASSYLALYAGWVLTNLESLFLGEALNILEHACYALSTLLLALWCRRVFRRQEGR